MMPANRSYDVFLLGRGTKLSLISHDTQIFISKTIAKTADKTCHEITISEKMECIIDKIGEHLLSIGMTCLPFYYQNLFTKLHSEFSHCIDDTDSRTVHEVRQFPIKCNKYVLPYEFSDYLDTYSTKLQRSLPYFV